LSPGDEHLGFKHVAIMKTVIVSIITVVSLLH